ncbi:MAG TPA: serine/threonine-protein kinase [Polyangiaceae bacterium]|nr:serine/threonine-protein kinase [Polyangiaceae bacterium]
MTICRACNSDVVDEARFCPFCGSPVLHASKAPKQTTIGPGAELDLEDWGRAVLGHAIGEGGMGVVYRGWLYYNPAGRFANTPPHPIAVKLLHPLLQGKARARKLFMREAAALARLSHPNIVHFFGLSDFDGQLALVMELVHGESLSDLLARVRSESRRGNSPLPALPLAQAWHYFAQLLGALASIHNLGILHRDIKSPNILVRGDGVIKVTDFGIAQVPAEEARNTGGMAPGTGAYMSPEQVLNQPLDPRADLYSAAIVLYEMLTGVTPFDRPERSELMVRAAQIEQVPAPLSSLLKLSPPVLDMLMARALAKDPTQRFGSAVEFGETFRNALGLPPTPGWSLQQELADVAKTMSQLQLPVPAAAELGQQAARMGTELMAAFRK